MSDTNETVTTGLNGEPAEEPVETAAKKSRKPGTLAGKKVILDPDWDRPQNDLNAWLAGDV